MWNNSYVKRSLCRLGAALALVTLAPAATSQVPTEKPHVGEGLKREKERLASYQWRLKTLMKVDGVVRLTRVDDVHLGPDGDLVRKSVRFEKKAPPTPLPENDPRARLVRPPTDDEDERLADLAQDLMQLYARLSPETLESWAARADLLPPDPDRPGLNRLHGRGLGRPQDDAVLYLDAGTKAPVEIEIKTTVDPRILDLAFIRVAFEKVPVPRPGAEPLVVPKRIFLNMDRGKRHVTLEMETSDYRSWP
jgi:hypothetical protein